MINISEELEKHADILFNNVSGWQTNALRRIGNRIKNIKSLSYADLQAINNAAVIEHDINVIMKELASVTELNVKEVQKVYSQMIEKQHKENKNLYDYRNKPYIPFEDNRELQALVKAYARTTSETFVNLSMTKARSIGFVDKNNNFIPLDIQFNKVWDKAVMSIASGTSDLNSEMRDVLKELGGSGLRVSYESGVIRRLDTMVRQNLLWGAKQASIEYNDMIGEELGCDGIEVDWHSNPRPKHEFMQGKQYSLSGRKTINGITYESADRALDALNDYGCLHFKTPIILGVSEPRYSKTELARLNKENAKPIIIDGVTKSGYEWKQTMRKLETEARKTKDQMTILRASGDTIGFKSLKMKLSSIEDKYSLVAEKTGMKPQYNRMGVIKLKNVDKSVNDGIMNVENEAMYRKTKADKIEPMPKKLLHKIEKSFKSKGGVFLHDDVTDSYLRRKKAEAVTYDAHTILLRKNPGRASVFEELIHATQYRNGENNGSYPSRLKCEIEAQRKLLRYSKSYGLTKEEIDQTQKALRVYEKELQAYNKKGGI